MKSLVRPELPTAALRSSQATHAAVDNSAPFATHPESTYKSGKVVQTTGATSFSWDEEDRRHRMARLDALFFHLYGIGRDDAAYILDTFPIVREEDEKAHGRYLTKDLVLAYLNAVTAGDLETKASV